MSEMSSRPDGTPPEPSFGYDKKAAETPISTEKENETLAWVVTGLRDNWLTTENHAKEQSHVLNLTDKLKSDQTLIAIQERLLDGLKIDPTNYILAFSQAREAVTSTLDENGKPLPKGQILRVINYQDQNGSAGQNSNLDRQVIFIMTPEQLDRELKAVENLINPKLPHDQTAPNEKILQAAAAIQKEMAEAQKAEGTKQTLSVDEYRVQDLTGANLTEPDEVKSFADARLSKFETTPRGKSKNAPSKDRPAAEDKKETGDEVKPDNVLVSLGRSVEIRITNDLKGAEIGTRDTKASLIASQRFELKGEGLPDFEVAFRVTKGPNGEDQVYPYVFPYCADRVRLFYNTLGGNGREKEIFLSVGDLDTGELERLNSPGVDSTSIRFEVKGGDRKLSVRLARVDYDEAEKIKGFTIRAEKI